MEYAPLYIEFIKIKFKGMAEYRSSFWLTSVSKASVFTVDFLLLWIIVDRFGAIAGWGPYEVLFLFALNLVSYSLAGFFFYHPCMGLPANIQQGDFDEVLVRPLNPLLYLMTRHFSLGYISNVTVALGALIISIVHLEQSFGVTDVLLLILSILGAALIQASLFLFTSVPAFWIIQSSSLSGLILFDIAGFIRYPIVIYQKAVQLFLTFILPLAFINYYPAQLFLGDKGELLHPSLPYWTPVLGLILFYGAYRFWLTGIRHYKSTGS